MQPSSLLVLLVYFFFSSRRRHTRCLSDWSSDVCSSDLGCRYPRGSHVRRTTEQALDSKEGAPHILMDSLADGLHLVEEGGEFAYSRITPGGIDPVIS